MQKKSSANLDTLIVTTATIAALFGITERRVRQLVDEGVIDRVKNGRYEVIPTVKKYVTYLKSNSEAQSVDDSQIDYFKERAVHEKAKREKAELELAVMKGNLHVASDVERVMNDMLVAFKSQIRGIGVKIAAQIKPDMQMAQISDLISREIDTTLTELSNYDPKKFYGEGYIMDDIDFEDDEDDTIQNN